MLYRWWNQYCRLLQVVGVIYQEKEIVEKEAGDDVGGAGRVWESGVLVRWLVIQVGGPVVCIGL